MPHHGLALRRGEDREDAVAALAEVRGLAAADLADLLDDAPRRGRRGYAWLPGVRSTHTFDAADRRDQRWWPQGISWPGGSATGSDGPADGRRVVALTWYAKTVGADPRGGHGCRITFYDVESHRYEHALVVLPSLGDDGKVRATPLRVHAGGLAWTDRHLHVAATAKGFHTMRLADLLRVEDLARPPSRVHTAGHRYVIPVHHSWEPITADGVEPLRYSFFSVDRSREPHGGPPSLLAGEYGRGQQSRRLVWFPLDPATGLPRPGPHGTAAATRVASGVRQMQGATVVEGRVHLTSSRGPRTPGSVYAGPIGDDDISFTERAWAVPMGPEDLDLDPRDGSLWTVTEHPRRRWVVELRTPGRG